MLHTNRIPLLVAGFLCLTLVGTAFGQQPFEPLPIDATQDPAPSDGQPAQDEAPSRLPTTLDLPQDQPPSSDQPVLVNSRFAGWEAASMQAEGSPITDRIRGSWVMLDPNGRFSGTIQAAAGAEVKEINVFLMHMGRLVKQTTVDATGRFVFNNVRQGAYALIGWGPNGFFAFGLNVIEHNDQATENLPPNEIQVLAYQNQTTINIDWIRHFAPRVDFRVYGRYPVGEGRDDPASLYGTLGAFLNPPVATSATSISSHDVWRTTDGRLVGRVHQLNSISGRPVDVRTTKVMLLEGDAVVGSTTTDNFGTFEFEGVPNGQFGILAAGVDGVGMITVNVVGDQPAEGQAEDAADHTVDFTMVPSETVGWMRYYASEIAYRRNLLKPRREPDADPNEGYFFPNGGWGLQNYCESRCLTFDQWLSACQGYPTGFGSGRFMEAAGAATRRSIDKMDRAYDRAFYPNESRGYGGYGGYNSGSMYGAPGYGGGYPGYGYGAPGYGYPNYGYPGNVAPGYAVPEVIETAPGTPAESLVPVPVPVPMN